MNQPITNDTAGLTPRTRFDGPALTFDLAGLLIGVAEYEDGPTGCTVFLFPDGARMEMDVRGGAVGSLGESGMTNAICLAGGSLLGLEAATGVAAEIFAQRGYKTGWTDIPLVHGAIINDFGRSSSVYPDKTLGRAAVRAAREGVFPLGACGAGRSATCGKFFSRGEPSGQGGAFLEIGGAALAVFTVINAVGAVVDRAGRVVRGNRDRETGERRSAIDQVRRHVARQTQDASRPGENTTLTVLVTNLAIGSRTLRQLAREVHSSMSRAIQPFHTATDGDVLFAVTTGVVADDRRLAEGSLGVLASELAWDAALAAVTNDSAQ